MTKRFERTKLLLGDEAMKKIALSHVAVFGIGGVGGYTVEALARAGVGKLDLIDGDVVSESNINRQIIALESTIGKKKAEVAKERIAQINPECEVNCICEMILPDTKDRFDFSKYDFVVDAIDTVSGKLTIIELANDANVPVISSMGTGNKLDPTGFEVADIFETSVCPLARVMRKELKARGINKLLCVYSKEEAIHPDEPDEMISERPKGRRATPGSVSFVPSVAGLIIAGEVIKRIAGID